MHTTTPVPDTADAAVAHLGRVARGGAVGLLGAAVSAIAGFLLVVVITHGVSPDRAGIFFSATAFFLMLVALASLGTDAGLARFLLRLEAQGRPDAVGAVLRTAVRVVLGSALLVGLVVGLNGHVISTRLGWGSVGGQLIVLFALALPAAVLSDLCLSATRAFGRMRTTMLVDRFVRAGSQPLLAIGVLLAGGGLVALTASWLLGYLLAAVLAVTALRRLRRARGSALRGSQAVSDVPGEPVVRKFWIYTWPRGLTRFAQIGIQKADIVLVAALLSPADAALYTAATRFVALGQFATQALQQVLQPRFTAILITDDRGTLREVYQVATAWNIALTWPVYLVIGCAPTAYLSVFGDGYAADGAAAAVVVVMMLAMLAAVASGPVDTLLLMAGRSRASLGNASVALALDVGLCLLLLPHLGIRGAALAWAAAVLARCGLAFVQVRRQLGVVPTGRRFAVASCLCVGCFGIPMAAASLLGLHSPVHWLVLGVVFSLGYLVLLHRFGRTLRLDVLLDALTRGRRPGREVKLCRQEP